MIRRIVLIMTAIIGLVACEMGADSNGPYKAYLLLKKPDNKVVQFYLGGYNHLLSCLNITQSEAENAPGMEFWTNADYSYGGREQSGWTKNIMVGAVCEKQDEDHE